MKRTVRRALALRLAGAVLAAAAVALPLAVAQPAVQRQSAETKMAEQVYKNVTRLKGKPADQLLPAMQYISASLGVDCAFCHVPGKMDLDDKPAKRTARAMMAMTASINKESFGGRQQVGCYSCHHGSTHVSSVPPVLESDAPVHAPPAAPPATSGETPTADRIIDKYVAALGGADAIRKVTSRVEKGAILANGTEMPIDVITKAPNKRMTITHSPDGDSITAFDGSVGWMGSAGRPPRQMTAAESAATGLDSEFYLALRLKEIFPQIRRARPEEIGGVECETLMAAAQGRPPVRLYFDKNSGLLVRVVRYADTPFGRLPTQIDYADYRDVDGMKTPFRWTLSRPAARFTIQIKEAQANVNVDDAKFAKPSGELK